MSSRAEMTRRVAPWRGVAAPDVTAFLAEAQRNPTRAFSQAILTGLWRCRGGKASRRQTDKVLAACDGHSQSFSMAIARAIRA